MLFMQTFPEWIVSGRKTQTRRPFHAGDTMIANPSQVLTAAGHVRWQVGSTYAVQTKRGGRGLWVDTRNGAVYTHEQRQELPDMVRVATPQPVLRSKEEGLAALAAAIFGSQVKVSSELIGDNIIPAMYDAPKLSPFIKPLRIVVTDLRLDDVRTISEGDARAEAFNGANDFLNVWIKLYDRKVHLLGWSVDGSKIWKFGNQYYTNQPVEDKQYARADFREFLNTRPAELYKAWAISFKVA